jgi:tRNA (guanine-N7-)-methyltransferase
MGRRALRAIDPALDLSEYLYELDDVPQPLAPSVFFASDAPLEVEMGSGKGLFMQSACEANPDRNFLGVEVSRKYARFSAARLAKREHTNGKMISGDGLRLFREFLTDESVRAVHVYFPDPWWKKRHKRRRVMKTELLQDVQRVLVPGGSLHFWTDVEEYFQTTLDLIAEEVALDGPIDVSQRPAEHNLDYRTHFERRMRLRDLPVFRSEFRKR